MDAHCSYAFGSIFGRIAGAKGYGFGKRHPIRYISVDWVVSTGLISKDVKNDAPGDHFWEDVGAVSYETDANGMMVLLSPFDNRKCGIKAMNHLVNIASVEPFLDARWIDIDTEENRTIHGCGKRLSTTHSANSTTDYKSSGK